MRTWNKSIFVRFFGYHENCVKLGLKILQKKKIAPIYRRNFLNTYWKFQFFRFVKHKYWEKYFHLWKIPRSCIYHWNYNLFPFLMTRKNRSRFWYYAKLCGIVLRIWLAICSIVTTSLKHATSCNATSAT
jgi:hypothetical protein